MLLLVNIKLGKKKKAKKAKWWILSVYLRIIMKCLI